MLIKQHDIHWSIDIEYFHFQNEILIYPLNIGYEYITGAYLIVFFLIKLSGNKQQRHHDWQRVRVLNMT